MVVIIPYVFFYLLLFYIFIVIFTSTNHIYILCLIGFESYTLVKKAG